MRYQFKEKLVIFFTVCFVLMTGCTSDKSKNDKNDQETDSADENTDDESDLDSDSSVDSDTDVDMDGDTDSDTDTDSDSDNDTDSDADLDTDSDTDNDTDSDTDTDTDSDVDSDSDSDTDGDSDTDTGTDEVYAHVTAVSVSGDSGNYTFSVTVMSADIDCSQYANWWEVLSEEGQLLYRRILEHSHTDENGTTDPDGPGNSFTRDGGPVTVTADTSVIVRAHMNTVGYVGMAMRGTGAGAFENAPDIDASFAADVEDDDPQPTDCLF